MITNTHRASANTLFVWIETHIKEMFIWRASLPNTERMDVICKEILLEDPYRISISVHKDKVRVALFDASSGYVASAAPAMLDIYITAYSEYKTLLLWLNEIHGLVVKP